MTPMLSTIVDLRSDTVTRPSEGMRRAMAAAEVGDDVYGEDPTVNRLEERCAALAGKGGALFVPSGSMANLVAQLCHVGRGDEVIVGEGSHCMRYEAGGGAALAGSQYAVVPGGGLFTAADVEARARVRSLHSPGTALAWIENTHNFGGGVVFPPGELRRIRELASGLGIALHMDGARVFNAAAACGRPVGELAALVDTLSFCFSKGLGAPVGSVLCGAAELIGRARRWRKMLGGGMRQAGVLAAAALYALDHNVERLAEDHANARLLAEGLAQEGGGLRVDPRSVETNIVMAGTGGKDPAALVRALGERGVLAGAVDRGRVRFVTHLDVSRRQVEEALPLIRAAAREALA